ncbi:DUF1634 domain-containing protein [Paraburkholderia sp. BL21I4N1]|uniref:DUF1634 domain-containing protein n=1 Tax=Paraburkholderia sp. BL21I4N1 TaxID=1938801 RepID=UPI000CFBB8B0|nr:DUF1634 domain-containing protein [Paraburkholderia sp. BL21I4N1]PQV52480.1 uncharacterized protein DUF1634 [Paraburkholderia sp. BL21I4N1]
MNTAALETKRLEGMLASLFHHGTWFSSAVITVGLALKLMDGHLAATASRLPSGTSVVTAGIALFIMLPVLRLAMMLFIFLRERDYMFSAITATVLTIIVLGTVLGLYWPIHGA